MPDATSLHLLLFRDDILSLRLDSQFVEVDGPPIFPILNISWKVEKSASGDSDSAEALPQAPISAGCCSAILLLDISINALWQGIWRKVFRIAPNKEKQAITPQTNIPNTCLSGFELVGPMKSRQQKAADQTPKRRLGLYRVGFATTRQWQCFASRYACKRGQRAERGWGESEEGRGEKLKEVCQSVYGYW